MRLRFDNLTEEQKDYIVSVYMEDQLLTSASKKLDMGYRLVRRVIESRDAFKKTNKRRSMFTDIEIGQIVFDYKERAFSCTSLASKYGTSVEIVRRIIQDETGGDKVTKFTSVNELMKYCYDKSRSTHKKILERFPVVA